MEPENPLLAPRLFWQVSLAITAVLVMIRLGIYLRQRSRSARAPVAEEPVSGEAAAGVAREGGEPEAAAEQETR